MKNENRNKSKNAIRFLLTAFVAAGLAAGCGRAETEIITETGAVPVADTIGQDLVGVSPGDEDTAGAFGLETNTVITPGLDIKQLKDGFSTVRYNGDYWFDNFIKQGGAASDSEVIEFLNAQLQLGEAGIGFSTSGFGCSTLAVRSPEGNALFGRNFDWENSEAMVIQSDPTGGYASISTVNMDFIRTGYGVGLNELPDEIRTIIGLYAPLDGMNEKGFAVSVNMIQDSAVIHQETEKPDITTTTAIRLMLDKAADVEEALALLEQYDMHSSMGMMVHFALADQSGRSVVVEYIGEEEPSQAGAAEGSKMVVAETPAVTNFYLSPGRKQGIGSAQSHTRYEMIMAQLSQKETMGMEEVRDVLDRVSKDNFGNGENPSHGSLAEGFESTEWSIVFDLDGGEARYYHLEDYENSYTFYVKE